MVFLLIVVLLHPLLSAVYNNSCECHVNVHHHYMMIVVVI